MVRSTSYALMFFPLALLCEEKEEVFFHDNLEQFLSRMTQSDTEKKEFRGYYSTFLKKYNKSSHRRIKGKLKKIRRQALCSIEVKHPELYTQLEPLLEFIDDASRCSHIRLYLTRYAKFEEYQKTKLMKQNGFWAKTKSYARRVRSKISFWKKRIKPKVTHNLRKGERWSRVSL